MASFYNALRNYGRSQTAASPSAGGQAYAGPSSSNFSQSSSAAPPQSRRSTSHPSTQHTASTTSRPFRGSHNHSQTQTPHRPPPRRPDDARPLSRYSTPTVRNSMWYCADFMVGAGMVVLQPATGKVLLLYDPRGQYWFFPKGRKDVGESLERTALREAYEESGYRVEFLPLFLPTNAPIPPSEQERDIQPCTEPFYVSTQSWSPRHRRRPDDVRHPGDDGGEYLTFWYIGQIAEDAVHEGDTGMPDEKEYQSHLLTLEEACARLKMCWMNDFASMLCMAYGLWQQTVDCLEKEKAERERVAVAGPPLGSQASAPAEESNGVR